jgi:hypothetical protein
MDGSAVVYHGEKSIHVFPGISRTDANAAGASSAGNTPWTAESGTRMPEFTASSVSAKSCGWS